MLELNDINDLSREGLRFWAVMLMFMYGAIMDDYYRHEWNRIEDFTSQLVSFFQLLLPNVLQLIHDAMSFRNQNYGLLIENANSDSESPVLSASY